MNSRRLRNFASGSYKRLQKHSDVPNNLQISQNGKKTQVYERFSYFTNDEMPIVDELQSGHPSSSRTDGNVEKIRAIVIQDRKRTIAVLQNYLAQFVAE